MDQEIRMKRGELYIFGSDISYLIINVSKNMIDILIFDRHKILKRKIERRIIQNIAQASNHVFVYGKIARVVGHVY